MKNLPRVLVFKMGITTVLWFVPLLFFPIELLRHLGFPDLGRAYSFNSSAWPMVLCW